ncbi:ABC transporter substrate-binding protein [Leptolyngbya sp. AN03gr2]|uniref:ABC transporter substrate-binding protein n=1 Tax=unclassified Leptolyngbya TaxID=2650499 RepID=UPI003D31C94A
MKRLMFVILMFCTLWLTVSCHPSPRLISQTDCYEVKHSAGTTCVPKTIKRLVTLDSASFENAIALGLTPVGTVLAEQSTLHLQKQQRSIVNVGQSGNPSLEAVLALKPDLIIGLSYHDLIYAQMSQIAPTVLLELGHSGKWKELFRDLGNVLNRSAIAIALRFRNMTIAYRVSKSI